MEDLIVQNPRSAKYLEKAISMILLGTDPNTRNKRWGNKTVLWSAIDYGSVEYVRILIDLGCDPYAESHFGEIPFDHAVQSHNYNMIEFFLKDIKINPNQMIDGETRMHKLCKEYRINENDSINDASIFKILELFARYGGHLDLKDKNDKTVYDVCLEFERDNVNLQFSLARDIEQYL